MQASSLLLLSDIVETTAQGDAMVSQVLDDGSALNKFEQMCICQGVSIETASRLCQNPRDVLPLSNTKIEIISTKSGYVSSINSLNLADIARKHGAGRFDIEDIIIPEVGFIITKNVGEKIDSGQSWMEFHYTTEPTDEEISLLNSSITISQQEIMPQPRLITVVDEASDK
jgi:thymidine phosphorylase